MSFGGKGKASRVSPGTPLIPFPVSSWPCLSAEGTSNLYHTNTRSREAISVSGAGLAYNATTGVVTIADVPTANVDGLDTALGLKAALASPTLSGTPLAPTAAAGTDTTQIATTAFVKDAIDTLRTELYAYDPS